MEKEDWLLLVLGTAGRVGSRTKLQKIVFLLQEEGNDPETENIFEYEPYYYGPFSSELAYTVECLRNQGFIEEKSYESEKEGSIVHGYDYLLTPAGRNRYNEIITNLDHSVLQCLREIVRKYNFQKLDAILEYVYRNHPDMKLSGGFSF